MVQEASAVPASAERLRLSWWQGFLAAGFAPLVGTQLALQLFAANGDHLVNPEQQLASVLLFLLGGWVVLFGSLQWGWWPGRLLWVGATSLALFFLVRDIVFPLPLGELNGSANYPALTPVYRITELATLAGIGMLLLVLRLRWTAPRAALATCVFAISSLATVVQQPALFGWHVAHPGNGLAPASVLSSRAPGGRRPDVYQILFDEYQTVEHRYLRRERGLAPFDDFICFENNVSNYNHTWLSLPSLFNGAAYPPERDIREWARSMGREGLVRSLKTNGYRINIFGYGKEWWKSPLSDHERGCYDIIREWQQGRPDDALLCLMGLRTLPSTLGATLHPSRRTVREDIPPATDLPFYTTIMFREMVRRIHRTPVGGNYTFVHLIMPHGPQIMDAAGDYVGHGKGSRLSHIQLVDTLVAELIAELRRLGRYDDSLIVVHADTGSYYFPNLDEQRLVNNESLTKVSSKEDWERDNLLDGARWKLPMVEARTNAALLVKPPRHQGYEVVSVPSQLQDLPATILGAVGLEEEARKYSDSCDLLAHPPGQARVRKTFVYGMKRDGVPQVPHMQEYLIRNGRFERAGLVRFTGKPW